MAYASDFLRCWPLLALLLLTSCMRTSDFEVDPVPPRLVVGAHFAPGEPWRVWVSGTTAPGERQVISVLDDALVEILDEGVPVATASFEREFWPGTTVVRREEYVSGYPVVPGGRYGVRVSAAGFDVAEGEDLVPAPVPAPELAVVSVGVNPGIRVRVTVEDPGPGADYFHLLFYLRVIGDTVRGNPVPMFRDPFSASRITSTDVGGVALNVGDWSGLLLNDENFPEGKQELSLDLGVLSQSFEDQRNVFELRAELRAVSKAYYDYYVSAIRQLELQGYAFAEPVPVFNNVSGGLGNVSGYAPVFSEWVVVR